MHSKYRDIKNQDNKISKNKFSFLKEIIGIGQIIILTILIRVFIFEPYYIPSGSMMMNFIKGDYVFSTKYDYGYSKHSIPINFEFINSSKGRFFEKNPTRGDVIIFRPPHMMDTRFVKRLIGLPGDKIEIINGVVFVNDKELIKKIIKEFNIDNKRYIQYEETNIDGKKYLVQYFDPEFIENLPFNAKIFVNHANNFGPFLVPEDNYFFLGDNRDESNDSRFDLKTVPAENLISKVRFIFFSFETELFEDDKSFMERILHIGTWIKSFRFERFFKKFD